MLLKLRLISHNILIGAVEVLVKLIKECLARNLHANAQDYLCIHNILFHGCLKDAHMSFAVLLWQLILLFLSHHYLIEVNLIVQVLVKLKTFERFDHLLYAFLQVFY